MTRKIIFTLAAAFLATGHAAAWEGDPGRGAELYGKRCGKCHTTKQHKIGPKHEGLIGRKAGSVPGFAFSAALRSADFIWDERRLYDWLRNPRKMVPGTRMGTRVSLDQDRKDLIAYLATLPRPQQPAKSD